jgi:hypothetical protein
MSAADNSLFTRSKSMSHSLEVHPSSETFIAEALRGPGGAGVEPHTTPQSALVGNHAEPGWSEFMGR